MTVDRKDMSKSKLEPVGADNEKVQAVATARANAAAAKAKILLRCDVDANGPSCLILEGFDMRSHHTTRGGLTVGVEWGFERTSLLVLHESKSCSVARMNFHANGALMVSSPDTRNFLPLRRRVIDQRKHAATALAVATASVSNTTRQENRLRDMEALGLCGRQLLAGVLKFGWGVVVPYAQWFWDTASLGDADLFTVRKKRAPSLPNVIHLFLMHRPSVVTSLLLGGQIKLNFHDETASLSSIELDLSTSESLVSVRRDGILLSAASAAQSTLRRFSRSSKDFQVVEKLANGVKAALAAVRHRAESALSRVRKSCGSAKTLELEDAKKALQCARAAVLDFDVFWAVCRVSIEMMGTPFHDLIHAVPSGDRSWRTLLLSKVSLQFAIDAQLRKLATLQSKKEPEALQWQQMGPQKSATKPPKQPHWFANLVPAAAIVDAFESQAQGYLVDKCLQIAEDAASTIGASQDSKTVSRDPWLGHAGLRRLALPLWVRQISDLKKLLDAIAKRKFTKDRCVEDIALYYAALGRKVALAQLYRTIDRDVVRAEFFSSDFSSPLMRAKAFKNAAFLHSRRRFSLAAAIYLVMDPPQIYKAMVSIGKGLDDPLLALAVGRVVEDAAMSRAKSTNAFSGRPSSVGKQTPRLGPVSRKFMSNYLVPFFKRHEQLLLLGTAMWWTNSLPVYDKFGKQEEVAPAGPREHFICERGHCPSVPSHQRSARENASECGLDHYFIAQVDRIVETELLELPGVPNLKSPKKSDSYGSNHCEPNFAEGFLSSLTEKCRLRFSVDKNQVAAATARLRNTNSNGFLPTGGKAGTQDPNASASAAGPVGNSLFASFGAQPKRAPAATQASSMFASFGAKPTPKPQPKPAAAPAASDLFASFSAKPKPKQSQQQSGGAAVGADMFASFGAKPKPTPKPKPSGNGGNSMFASFSAKPAPKPKPSAAPAGTNDIFSSFGVKAAPSTTSSGSRARGTTDIFASFAPKATASSSQDPAAVVEEEDDLPPAAANLFKIRYTPTSPFRVSATAVEAPSPAKEVVSIVSNFVRSTFAMLYHTSASMTDASTRVRRQLRGRVEAPVLRKLVELADPHLFEMFSADEENGDRDTGAAQQPISYIPGTVPKRSLCLLSAHVLRHAWPMSRLGHKDGHSREPRFLPRPTLMLATSSDVAIARYNLATKDHGRPQAAEYRCRQVMREHLANIATFLQRHLLVGLSVPQSVHPLDGKAHHPALLCDLLLERNEIARSVASLDNATALFANVVSIFHARQQVRAFVRATALTPHATTMNTTTENSFVIATFCLEQQLLLTSSLALGYTEGFLAVVERFCSACQSSEALSKAAAADVSDQVATAEVNGDADSAIWEAMYKKLQSICNAAASAAAGAAVASASARPSSSVVTAPQSNGAEPTKSTEQGGHGDNDNPQSEDRVTSPTLSTTVERLTKLSLIKRSPSVDSWKMKWGRHVETQLVLTFLQYFGLSMFASALKQACAGKVFANDEATDGHNGSLVTIVDECRHTMTFSYALSSRLESFALSDLRRQISCALARLQGSQREAQQQYARSSGIGEIFQRLRTDYVREIAMRFVLRVPSEYCSRPTCHWIFSSNFVQFAVDQVMCNKCRRRQVSGGFSEPVASDSDSRSSTLASSTCWSSAKRQWITSLPTPWLRSLLTKACFANYLDQHFMFSTIKPHWR
mgnify:CR=1 FL=1